MPHIAMCRPRGRPPMAEPRTRDRLRRAQRRKNPRSAAQATQASPLAPPITAPRAPPARRRRSLRVPAVDFRARGVRRLLRGVVGDAGAAYAADVGDQRDLLGDRGRRAARGRRRLVTAAPDLGARLRLRRADLRLVNIFGGFLVTQRMLAMFKKRNRADPCERQSRRAALSRRRRPVHPGAARPVQPGTSRRGNLFGMIGMAIAVATTLARIRRPTAIGLTLVVLGIAIGGGDRRRDRAAGADDAMPNWSRRSTRWSAWRRCWSRPARSTRRRPSASARPAHPPQSLIEMSLGARHRRHHLHRLGDRVRQAVRRA
jgi:hypothetical protein